MTGFAHPETLANGQKLWMDGSIRDLIHRIRFGDPLLGWEGDDRIELYWDDTEERFELWRCEDDYEYRRICRSGPGVAFDERVIHALVQWDGRRRTKALVDEVNDHNEGVRADIDAQRDEWIAEDIAPRLRHAIRKDG
jgi:hypothetical protein